MKNGYLRSRCQTSKWCTGKPDPLNLYQDEAFVGVETRERSSTHHLDPPDLPWHECYSDGGGRGASGRWTVLVNDRNGGTLRLIASRLMMMMMNHSIPSSTYLYISPLFHIYTTQNSFAMYGIKSFLKTKTTRRRMQIIKNQKWKIYWRTDHRIRKPLWKLFRASFKQHCKKPTMMWV